METVYEWYARKRRKEARQRAHYQEAVQRLQKRGVVKLLKKRNAVFISLTKKGVLEKLLKTAAIDTSSPWDGKWRVLVFDIPESARPDRDRFRWLLKRNNFVKLQASVFVSPYPLNQAAIDYLESSGLNEFIRVMRVDKMDNDIDLRKKFNLQKEK